MQISVETVKGLQRKMTVSIPSADIDSAVEKKLKSIKSTVKIDGFRPGKVPAAVVKKRYGDSIRSDVLGEVIQSSYGEALAQEGLKPAGNPSIDLANETEGEDITYVAAFEVYPEIELSDNSELNFEKPVVKISETDIDEMLEKLRSQHKTWAKVDRKSKDGDQVTISFVGTIEGEEFEGGKADDISVVLGSNSMIDGFEKGLLDLASGDQTTLDLTFPENYQKEDLSSKAVKFNVTLSQVAEEVLPEIDAEFTQKFGIEKGDVKALREQIKTNLERERKQYVRQFTKTQVVEALHDNNDKIEIPSALIDQEVQSMLDNLKRQMQGNANIDDLIKPETMKPEAERRVRLSLIMGEILDKNKITLDDKKLKDFIEAESTSYEDPKQFVNYYMNNDEALNSIKPLVLEQQVVEHVIDKASIKEVELKFSELVEKVQPKQG